MFINFCCSCSNRILLRSCSKRSFQTSVTLRKSYYEILGLKNDCTQKEIRNAFVLLSKEYHPDMNTKDTKSNKEFIQVMEAYQVLSKAHSRANYDLSLKGIDTVNYIRRDTFHEPWKAHPMSYAEKDPNYSSYYGIRGFRRVKNSRIVLICFLFLFCGAMLQGFAIRRSISMYRSEVRDHKSAINSALYQEVRKTAEKNGNALQLEKISQLQKRSPAD